PLPRPNHAATSAQHTPAAQSRSATATGARPSDTISPTLPSAAKTQPNTQRGLVNRTRARCRGRSIEIDSDPCRARCSTERPTVYTTADRSATKSPSTGERLSARGDRHQVDVHHKARAPASGVAAPLSRRGNGRAEQPPCNQFCPPEAHWPRSKSYVLFLAGPSIRARPVRYEWRSNWSRVERVPVWIEELRHGAGPRRAGEGTLRA